MIFLLTKQCHWHEEPFHHDVIEKVLEPGAVLDSALVPRGEFVNS